MTPAIILVLTAFLSVPALAQGVSAVMVVQNEANSAPAPADPQFREQMALLQQGWPELRARDVVVIQDTNPDRATLSLVRQHLRPRGFSLIWIDKDGNVRLRKPVVWSARELVHAIDKSPIRMQEMLDERTGR